MRLKKAVPETLEKKENDLEHERGTKGTRTGRRTEPYGWTVGKWMGRRGRQEG